MRKIKQNRAIGWLILVIVLGGFNSTISFAQEVEQPKDQIIRFLGMIESRANQVGFIKTQDHLIDKLDKGATHLISIELDGGKVYIFIPVCDQECSDFPIRLLDSDGREVARDSDVDDVPFIQFSSEMAGIYQLEVKMSSCSKSHCYYGVGIFAKVESENSANPEIYDHPGPVGRQLNFWEKEAKE